jgi:hypothetical protein
MILERFKIEVRWAFIFILMTLTWMFFERIAGLHSSNIKYHPVFTNLILLPVISIFVLALKDKKKNFYKGKMNFKQAFMTGAAITLIVALLNPVTQYFISTVITPHFFENAIKYAVENNKMDKVKAEEYFNLKTYIIQGTIGAFVMGLIISAVVSIFFTSKKK